MASEAEIFCIDPARVSKFWPYAKDLIRRALDRTKLGDFDVFEADILAGRQLLWLIMGNGLEAAVTTRLSMIGGAPIVTITACSGYESSRWLALHEKIERYARDQGAKALRIIGRKGWERVLDGYRAQHVILEKELV